MNKTEVENEFMQKIHVLYLNWHCVSLAECYRNAKEIFERHGFVNVPSLSTVRRRIKRLPKDMVSRERDHIKLNTRKKRP